MMKVESTESKYLKAAGLLILYLLLYLIIYQTCIFVYFQKMGKLVFAGKFLKDNIPLFHLFQDAFYLPVFMLVFALFKKKNLFKAVNFGSVNWKTVGILTILAFFVSLFTASFMKMPWSESLFPNVAMLLNTRLLAQHPLQFIIWLPLHCAIWREILFRGIIYNEFKQVMPFSLAIIFQGLMQGFLFFLFTKLDLVFYGLLGAIIFGLIYAWCKSLWASIIAQLLLETFLFIWKSANWSIFTKDTAPIILGCSMVLLALSLLYLREYTQSFSINNGKSDVKASVKNLSV